MVINLSSAITFSFDYPKIIQKNQEFSIKLNSEVNENYDVKAYVYHDTKEYSEILSDGKWGSAHFYLISAFPETNEFTLKSHYLGETDICVQMRKSGTKKSDRICNPITVEENSSQNNEDNNSESDDTKDNQTENIVQDYNSKNKDKKVILNYENKNTQKKVVNLSSKSKEKIILNSPNTNSSKSAQQEFTSKKYAFRIWIVYSFTGLCVMIIILLSLRKL